MKRIRVLARVILIASWLLGFSASAPAAGNYTASRYDVVWDSPSGGPAGSVPLGNGAIGLNAWVETGGDLLFYISKTDFWDDNGRLVKAGRVRIHLDPVPSVQEGFAQRLSLNDATLYVQFGQGEAVTKLILWVDANHPMIHVSIDSPRPVTATAKIELWRSAPYELPSIEVSDVLLDRSQPGDKHGPTIVEPDTLLIGLKDRVGWYHHNQKSVGPELTLKIQGLTGLLQTDPLLNRIFGAIISAENAQRIDDQTLVSPEAASHRFDIGVLTCHPATPEEWLRAIEQAMTKARQLPFEQRRQAHERWWREFWDRSWIHVTTAGVDRSADEENDDAFVVSRGYALQRFINACAGRGEYPIKFNGSIFTVDWPDVPGGPDYRRWGPGYWWQNTRLPYYGMCAAGDFDLMAPLFRMYIDELLPFCMERTRRYFEHEGAYYPECIYFWGAVFSESYGWTPFEERQDPLQVSGYHKWEWVGGLELAFLALDYSEYTQDETFLTKKAIPLANAVMTFFDKYYKTGPDGKLVMHPSQAVETWWKCTNPMPELAGLHVVTARLLALPEQLTTAKQRSAWAALRQKLPDLPTREVNGIRMLAPAEKFEDKRNIENPELYAVFPFRLFAFDKPHVDLAVQALNHRWDKGNSGWRQDDVFMAYLGLTEEAREYLVGRARSKHEASRFPAFWGPNYDWVPDQDHGSILIKTLQAMVLQSDGNTIHLLPAWPKDWNVSFKLHAPRQTVLECEYQDGKITRLEVTPSERAIDVVKSSRL